MNVFSKSVLCATALMLSSQVMAQVTFYEGEGFRGRAFSEQRAIRDLGRYGFNDRASSVIVQRGYWEVCEHSRHRGNCRVLQPGSYDSLQRMGLSNRISSTRPVNANRRYDNLAGEPLHDPGYQYRHRPNERTYRARVTSARAVMGRGEQECWIEREHVQDRRRGDSNTGGAVAGAIIGGILGHQVGSGSGQTAATVGGAAIGAAIGSNSGRDGRHDRRGYGRDVQRCETRVSGHPLYWDVSYNHRNQEHWVRMEDAPGQYIAVNRNGEPRQ